MNENLATLIQIDTTGLRIDLQQDHALIYMLTSQKKKKRLSALTDATLETFNYSS